MSTARFETSKPAAVAADPARIQQSLEDAKLATRLIVRHAIANTRLKYEEVLRGREKELTEQLLAEFAGMFPTWSGSFKRATTGFEKWLETSLNASVARLSSETIHVFAEPVHTVGRQVSQLLEDAGNRIQRKVEPANIEVELEAPRSPDIHVGKLFDREWQMISFLLPMPAIKGTVERHFRRQIAYAVVKNLSRLATSWESATHAALVQMEEKASNHFERLQVLAKQQADNLPAESVSLEGLVPLNLTRSRETVPANGSRRWRRQLPPLPASYRVGPTILS